jgi:hypothetical protein
MEKAEFGGESDPQFSGKGWTDMTEFGTVGKAMYDFPIVVNSIPWLYLARFRSNFTSKSNFCTFARGGPFKTLQNLNRVEFSSPVFTS